METQSVYTFKHYNHISTKELNIIYFWKTELIRKLKMLLIVGYHLQWRDIYNYIK